MSKTLEGRLALVTGASRGIGREVALELARQGADIIAIARNRSQGALEELDDEIQALGSNCTIAPMDIRDGDAIDRLGAAIYERWGKLDIMVANAAVLGPISPIGHIGVKDWAELVEVNITSNFRLIRSMDLLLKKSDAGRAIFVTSAAAGKHRAYWGGYAATKAAVEELALTYAAECGITSIRTNVIDPGPIRTHMRALAVPGEDPNTLPTPDQIAPLFAELASPECDKNGEVVKFYDWAGIKRA
ncbi:SDR family NAD(P)-dependent oxidoreductase [Kordiimonas laminariae]|uniref:SDR family NAD(P)-dependent oxidoreductase n=1 Tax=Kordiimonas laminariae TaxID=2917717 RepID=UPI001FF31065|nr:SDR family NAD(P)-dependent oxidoreductase [Kordiimonas laminariae]MCK0070388.1 SDR family NAD(P)-dependent oxidoreductase [Kordiimonas laminariae]